MKKVLLGPKLTVNLSLLDFGVLQPGDSSTVGLLEVTNESNYDAWFQVGVKLYFTIVIENRSQKGNFNEEKVSKFPSSSLLQSFTTTGYRRNRSNLFRSDMHCCNGGAA